MNKSLDKKNHSQKEQMGDKGFTMSSSSSSAKNSDYTGMSESLQKNTPSDTHIPLDKKIKEWINPWNDNCSAIATKDVKSSLSNLKKRLKEETLDCIDENGDIDHDDIEKVIDKLFLEEIGSGLLEGEND